MDIQDSTKKRKSRVPHKFILSPVWHTVYSDLVTNLTLFFLILFASTRLASTQRAQVLTALAGTGAREGAVTVRAQQVLRELEERETLTKIDHLTREEAFAKYAKLEINEQIIKITLRSPVLFASAENKLQRNALPVIDEVAEFIASVSGKVIVEGYTDNVPVVGGRYKSNWELSVARAFSVINYLTKEKGLLPERFIAAGYGEFRPVYPNDTPEHRAMNRRIELTILRGTL